VARTLGIGVDEESVLQQGHLVLEINRNVTYLAGSMGQVELRVTNVSNEGIERILVTGNFGHLPDPVKSQTRRIETGEHKTVQLPFHYQFPGSETVEVWIDYTDAIGNPSVYSTQFRFDVFDKTHIPDGSKSISVSIQAEKILGCDLSRMVEMSEKEAPRERSAPKSFARERTEEWTLLPLYFETEETERRRKEIEIEKNYRQAESLVARAQIAKDRGNRLHSRDPEEAKQAWQEAFGLYESARDCYMRVRIEDPDHRESLQKLAEVKQLLGELQKRLGVLSQGRSAPKVRITSGILSMPRAEKKVFLYSKERLTIGRLTSNDIILRIVPYQPPERYPENYEKNLQISGNHATIATRNGAFFLSDTGKDGKGSKNGTFLYGKMIKPAPQEYQLKHGARINIAGVLELEISFMWSSKEKKSQYGTSTACLSVLGDDPASCFGIDIDSALNAVKLIRTNNFTDGEEYIIVVRGVTIGCSPNSGIVLDGETVSDIHAELFYRDMQYWIVDRNSKHGTWVNGQKAEPGVGVPLGKGAEIKIGDEKLRFEGKE
jgi:pSer/pThr/pTyr-binding forkhead associated (FHA) protein